MAQTKTRPFDERPAAEARGVGRRALLTGLGGAGVSAAAAVAIGSEPAPEPQAAADRSEPSYRETEHIRNFYARSRF